MTSNHSSPKVWIDPPRYYAATADMTPEQIDGLLHQINAIAEAGRYEELKKYDFVLTENPYLIWSRARQHH